MEVIHKRCAGGDVDAKRIVVCVRIARDRRVHRETRTFETTTKGLLALADWLEESRCTHILLESTGVYWRPVYHILSERLTVVLANAAEVKNVPGRKSDVNDATWIADLMAHGLMRGSFVPPRSTQEQRDLTRTRKQLVREVVQHTQRIQKVLADANINISSIVTDTLGRSGRAILDAIAVGETDPEKLVCLLNVRVKKDRLTAREALSGRVTEHHRFMVQLHLRQIDALQAAIGGLDTRLQQVFTAHRDEMQRLTDIPGVSQRTAEIILSEIGTDMRRFETAGHLRSWAGLCPRLDESAGKRRSTRVRNGNVWLKTTLVQAAWAAMRKKDTYLRTQFLRLQTRRGPKKAAVAVAASILTISYNLLRDGSTYQDLGPNYFDERDRSRVAKRLLRRLTDLGLDVHV